MDAYTEKLNSIGDSLIKWADPEGQFTGYTEVSSDLKQWYLGLRHWAVLICFPSLL